MESPGAAFAGRGHQAEGRWSIDRGFQSGDLVLQLELFLLHRLNLQIVDTAVLQRGGYLLVQFVVTATQDGNVGFDGHLELLLEADLFP